MQTEDGTMRTVLFSSIILELPGIVPKMLPICTYLGLAGTIHNESLHGPELWLGSKFKHGHALF